MGENFIKLIDWLLMDYLKLEKVLNTVGDLKYLIEHDEKRYENLFTVEYFKDKEIKEIKDACDSNDTKLIEKILKRGTINITDIPFNNESILRFSLISDDVNINTIRFLLDHITKKDSKKEIEECFWRVIRNGEAEILKLFLDMGFINLKGNDQINSYINHAMESHGNLDIMKILLPYSDNINYQNRHGKTLLI